MELFNQEYTLTISGLTILIMSLGLGTVVVVLIAYNYYLAKKLRALQQPAYGFLGKPLYSLLTIALITGSFMVLVNPNFLQELESIEASKSIEAQITTEIVNQDNNLYLVRFEFVPLINDKPWGNGADFFDVLWMIDGVNDYEKYEFERSITNPSGFELELTGGTYDINITLLSGNKVQTFQKSLYLF